MSSEKSGHSEHILPSAMYWGIWALLIVLTVVTAWVANIDLGRFNTVVALVIATCKATVVVLFFMHVKYTQRKIDQGCDYLGAFLPGHFAVVEYGGLRHAAYELAGLNLPHAAAAPNAGQVHRTRPDRQIFHSR